MNVGGCLFNQPPIAIYFSILNNNIDNNHTRYIISCMIFSSVRTLVELPVNPLNPEHSQPDNIFGINNRRWSEALTQLGLVVVTPYPALSIGGERLPDIKATLYDKALLDAGQYALLSMV